MSLRVVARTGWLTAGRVNGLVAAVAAIVIGVAAVRQVAEQRADYERTAREIDAHVCIRIK